MTKKKTIRLTESELKNMVVGSVKTILKENCGKVSHRGFNAMSKLYEETLRGTHSDICYQLAEDLLEVMEPISLIAKLGERMGFFAMREYLEDIARIEMPDNYGQDDEF